MMMEDKGDMALPSDRAGGRCPEPAAQSQPEALIPSAGKYVFVTKHGRFEVAAAMHDCTDGYVNLYNPEVTYPRERRTRRQGIWPFRKTVVEHVDLQRTVRHWVATFALSEIVALTYPAQAMSAGTAETQGGSGRQPASAVAEGHAPHPNQDTPHE